MKYLFAIALLCTLSVSGLFGQYEDRYWIFGRANAPLNRENINFDFYPGGASLYDISGAPPAMMPAPDNITGNNGFEGWGVVTDPQTGVLVFYTDGEDVFNADHQPITPPGGLGANPSSSQAVAVAVNPVCPFDQYYIFSNPTGVFNGNTDGPVTYRLYTVGSGFSDVQLLPGPEASSKVGEGMTVIPSKTDPFTSWLVVRLLAPTAAGSEYVVYEINEMGISFNDVYTFGPAITDNPYSPIMNMTYTDDGSAEHVVVGFSVSGSPNRVFTNTFNTTTGTFGASANVVATFSAGTLYDLAFSPEGNYIYYASYFPSRLYQVPTAGGTAQQMYSFGNLRGGGLKAAPDGYVYHIYDAGANDNSGQVRMGRIVAPETLFDGTNFDAMYQAGFNSGVSMVFDDVFSYNFPEFASVPSWSAELAIEGDAPPCTGETALLTATINSLGQTVESYTWSLDGAVLSTTAIAQLDIDQGGLYQVTVELAGGCTIVSDILPVETAAPVQIDQIITTPTDCGTDDGAILIEASGGTGQLMYSLSGSDFTGQTDYTNLSAGLYSVIVMDELGCTASQVVEIEQTQAGPMIDAVTINPASCLDGDGSVEIIASGGLGLIRYALVSPEFQTSGVFTAVSAGVYTIVVVDAIGCQSTMEIEVPQLDNGPQIEAVEAEAVSCIGNDGSLSLIASGGTGALMYSLDGTTFQPTSAFSGLSAGTYEITVIDELGCRAIETVEVEERVDLPIITAITLRRPACQGEDGQISLFAEGGSGDLQFALNGGVFQSSGTFAGLSEGTYVLRVQDELGCRADSTLVLLEENCPVYIPNVFSPNNDGLNDRFQVFSNGDPGTFISHYSIFDRWGELVYENDDFHPADVSQFWDGTFRGEPLGAGVFIYLVEVGYADGTTASFAGDVLLLR